MTSVTCIDTKIYEDGPCFERAFSCISDHRKEKILKYRFAKDRNLSLGAAVLLDEALKEKGFREKDMIYLENEKGKPEFAGNIPFFFNISHSGTMAMLAVSDFPVGCDIEEEKDADLRMAERWFSENEKRYVFAGKKEAERKKRFYRCWTRKESFVKMLGEGLARPMDSYCVVNKNGRAECPAEGDTAYRFFENMLPGYYLCVCAERKGGVGWRLR